MRLQPNMFVQVGRGLEMADSCRSIVLKMASVLSLHHSRGPLRSLGGDMPRVVGFNIERDSHPPTLCSER
ncbi:hypothetical protein J6590_072811 [Homalodisca vitripennis]|nr:hypothetical protein J6590_072811 [Homalodisca vitripennis]